MLPQFAKIASPVCDNPINVLKSKYSRIILQHDLIHRILKALNMAILTLTTLIHSRLLLHNKVWITTKSRLSTAQPYRCFFIFAKIQSSIKDIYVGTAGIPTADETSGNLCFRQNSSPASWSLISEQTLIFGLSEILCFSTFPFLKM